MEGKATETSEAQESNLKEIFTRIEDIGYKCHICFIKPFFRDVKRKKDWTVALWFKVLFQLKIYFKFMQKKPNQVLSACTVQSMDILFSMLILLYYISRSKHFQYSPACVK